jgi:TRAP-type C4-dicarboxylate transport system substrate-binding protein
VLGWVTFNGAVPDSQVYSCNLEWFNGLPKKVQEGIEFASEVTMQQNLAKVPAARAYAMAELAAAGVKFYVPTANEKKQWVDKAGAQLPAWDSFKKELAGSLSKFDSFQKAANTMGRYYVHDVKA